MFPAENVYNTPPRAAEIEDGREQEDQPEARQEDDQYVDDGRPWYPGRAREEFDRKLSGKPADQDDDPVQVDSFLPRRLPPN